MDGYDFSYRSYTVAELEDWLFHQADNGLSDAVIARPRALAFVRNPHARPDDVALVVVFNEKNEPVGYTGAYAEQWVHPTMPERYFWGSTQWMNPEYRGKGISWNMMRQIKDAVADRYISLDSTPASCRLDEKQGSIISYYPRYFFVLRGDGKSVKSKVKNVLSNRSLKKASQNLEEFGFKNRYVSLIDDETYSFIVAHSEKDLFLRKKDFLNWQVLYPFVVPTGDDRKLDVESCEFGGYVKKLQTMMVQVFVDGKMCGFYMLRMLDSVCSAWYLYYEESMREHVFASVALNVLRRKDVFKFQTFNKDLFDFMQQKGVKSQFSKTYIDKISLTIPCGFEVDATLRVHGGDGDMMC